MKVKEAAVVATTVQKDRVVKFLTDDILFGLEETVSTLFGCA